METKKYYYLQGNDNGTWSVTWSMTTEYDAEIAYYGGRSEAGKLHVYGTYSTRAEAEKILASLQKKEERRQGPISYFFRQPLIKIGKVTVLNRWAFISFLFALIIFFGLRVGTTLAPFPLRFFGALFILLLASPPVAKMYGYVFRIGGLLIVLYIVGNLANEFWLHWWNPNVLPSNMSQLNAIFQHIIGKK